MSIDDHQHRPPDREGLLERAAEHLKKAEHDLEAAHEGERRAEKEIREAEHEIEEALHHEIGIIVNARPRQVDHRRVTFEEVLRFAFPGSASDQNVVFSMTYRHAASNPHAGELGQGGKVKVKEGTVFNVSRTVRS